jgi:hypothetical protein
MSVEPLVLEDEDQVVDAKGRGKAAVGVVPVIDDQDAGKAGIDPRRGLAMEMGMVPQRRGRLRHRQKRPPRRSRRDLLMWAAVAVAGHEQSVPVDGDRYIGAVGYACGDLGARADADDRTEIGLVEPKGRRRNAGNEFRLAGNRRNLEGAARCRINHRQWRRKRRRGGPPAARDEARCSEAKRGRGGGLQELAARGCHWASPLPD